MDTQNTNWFCDSGHQPLDYADFSAKCSNIRDWGNGSRMRSGECHECKSTISYPASTCQNFAPYTATTAQTSAQIARIQARTLTRSETNRLSLLDGDMPITETKANGLETRQLQRLPKSIKRELALYVEQRRKPGPFLYAMLSGDITGASEAARTSGCSDLDVLAMSLVAYWCVCFAPLEIVGSSTAVERWLLGAN